MATTGLRVTPLWSEWAVLGEGEEHSGAMGEQPIFSIKANDRGKSVQIQVRDDAGAYFDFTGYTIKFFMRPFGGGTNKVNGTAGSIVSASTGVIKYDFAAADVDTAGSFEAEFQATSAGGLKLTFPSNGYILVEITEDLGD